MYPSLQESCGEVTAHQLNAEVDVVLVPNGAYRSFKETLSSIVRQVARKTNNVMCFNACVDLGNAGH